MATTAFERFASRYIYELIADAIVEDGVRGAWSKLFYNFDEPRWTETTLDFLEGGNENEDRFAFEKIGDDLYFIVIYDNEEKFREKIEGAGIEDRLRSIVLEYLE